MGCHTHSTKAASCTGKAEFKSCASANQVTSTRSPGPQHLQHIKHITHTHPHTHTGGEDRKCSLANCFLWAPFKMDMWIICSSFLACQVTGRRVVCFHHTVKAEETCQQSPRTPSSVKVTQAALLLPFICRSQPISRVTVLQTQSLLHLTALV